MATEITGIHVTETKRRRYGMKATCLAVVLVLMQGLAFGQTVNWDIQTVSGQLYSGSDGVLSGSGTYWNNSASNWLNALDESGAPTTIDLVLKQWMGSIINSGSHLLFKEGLAAGWSSPLIYDITDLDPYKTYDLALYFQASARADIYVYGDGQFTNKETVFANSHTLPGTEGGEYLRMRDWKPYELTNNTYGIRFYVYSQSSIINEGLVGVQIKNTGTRANIPPHIPISNTPTNNATGIGLTPTLNASAFNDPDGGDTHANSQWLVDNNSNFSSPEWNSGDTYAASTSATLSAGILASSTKYYWRVRYKDSSGNWSPYSSSFNFTTAAGNGAPTNILLSSTNISENLPVSTKVGHFTTQDPDAGNTFTYTLVAGAGEADNGSFTISGSNLLTAAVFNYEVKSNFSIRVQSTDQGSLTTQKVFAIKVADVDETPVFYGPSEPTNGNIVLRWSSTTNKLYSVHHSTNLLTGFTVLQSNIPATPAINSYTQSVLTIPQKFWKITTDQ